MSLTLRVEHPMDPWESSLLQHARSEASRFSTTAGASSEDASSFDPSDDPDCPRVILGKPPRRRAQERLSRILVRWCAICGVSPLVTSLRERVMAPRTGKHRWSWTCREPVTRGVIHFLLWPAAVELCPAVIFRSAIIRSGVWVINNSAAEVLSDR
jgi:hypothetical protein